MSQLGGARTCGPMFDLTAAQKSCMSGRAFFCARGACSAGWVVFHFRQIHYVHAVASKSPLSEKKVEKSMLPE